MSKEETADRLKKKFLDKGMKDEAMIVLVALNTDLPEDKVEKYMTTDLNFDQLVEMMVAIMDGLPSTTLETFALGKTEAADMRALRLRSRGDTMFQILSEQVLDVKELVERIKVSDPGQDKTTKMIRELKSEITSVRGCVESIDERLGGGEEKAKENNKKVTKAVAEKEDTMKTETVAKNDAESQEMRLRGYQSRMAYPSEKDARMAAGNGTKPMDYVTANGMEISISEKPTINARSILSIFRKTNEDKVPVMASESEKRKAINKIVSLGLEEDKLKALSVGARAGVDPETLKKFAQKGSSASQIYNYINIFGALFIENFKPITVSA